MSDPIDELEELLRSVSHGIFGLAHDVVRRHRLPAGSKPVIHQVLKNPGVTVSEISRKAGVAKSHVSKVVEGLAKAGLVEKRADPSDQRLLRLYATEQAMEQFDAIRDEMRRRLSRVADGLPTGRLEEIIKGLRTLRDAIASETARHGVDADKGNLRGKW